MYPCIPWCVYFDRYVSYIFGHLQNLSSNKCVCLKCLYSQQNSAENDTKSMIHCKGWTLTFCIDFGVITVVWVFVEQKLLFFVDRLAQRIGSAWLEPRIMLKKRHIIELVWIGWILSYNHFCELASHEVFPFKSPETPTLQQISWLRASAKPSPFSWLWTSSSTIESQAASSGKQIIIFSGQLGSLSRIFNPNNMKSQIESWINYWLHVCMYVYVYIYISVYVYKYIIGILPLLLGPLRREVTEKG